MYQARPRTSTAKWTLTATWATEGPVYQNTGEMGVGWPAPNPVNKRGRSGMDAREEMLKKEIMDKFMNCPLHDMIECGEGMGGSFLLGT